MRSSFVHWPKKIQCIEYTFTCQSQVGIYHLTLILEGLNLTELLDCTQDLMIITCVVCIVSFTHFIRLALCIKYKIT